MGLFKRTSSSGWSGSGAIEDAKWRRNPLARLKQVLLRLAYGARGSVKRPTTASERLVLLSARPWFRVLVLMGCLEGVRLLLTA